jgi:alkylresorcinol/alkylpyrone synthase
MIALATASPPFVLRQSDVQGLAQRLFSGTLAAAPALIKVFDHAQIETRHVCVPLTWFDEPHTFGEKNDRYIADAQRLACEAGGKALDQAGLRGSDIDHVVFVSSTGIATPSIDARIAGVMDLRPDVRRTPIWGLGCAGGVAGLARARELALADPASRVLFIALELCSLTFQHGDNSKRNLVAASLFADGAAAAVVVGADVATSVPVPRGEVRVIASASTLWRDSVDVMGWEVDGDGLHVVFSQDIPSIVRDRLGPSLQAFLEKQGLQLADIAHMVVHPGGVKVLRAYSEALECEPEALRHARDVLREHGNMSSPSCLFVLERFLAARQIQPGERAIMAALGPGFCAEFVLLEGAA